MLILWRCSGVHLFEDVSRACLLRAAGQNLPHGLAVGIRGGGEAGAKLVFSGDKLPAYVDAYFVNGLVVHLLHVEAVVYDEGVVEHLGGYEHH